MLHHYVQEGLLLHSCHHEALTCTMLLASSKPMIDSLLRQGLPICQHIDQYRDPVHPLDAAPAELWEYRSWQQPQLWAGPHAGGSGAGLSVCPNAQPWG